MMPEMTASTTPVAAAPAAKGAVLPAHWRALCRTLARYDRFVLTTHVDPDHDALGSEVALARTLEQMGKTVHILNASPLPEDCRFLTRGTRVLTYNPARHGRLLRECEVIVMLDLSHWPRLGALADPVRESGALKVCLDHHPVPLPIGDVAVIDPSFSSTAEMVFQLLGPLRAALTPEIARALYCGLVMDTGRFLFASTSARTLCTAASLLKAGVDLETVHRELFYNKTERYFHLLSEVLSTLRVRKDLHLGYFQMTESLVRRLRVNSREADGFCDLLRQVREVTLALFFRPLPGGSVKITLRSRGGANPSARRLALALGGGGHEHASGAIVPGPMARTLRATLATAAALAEKSPARKA